MKPIQIVYFDAGGGHRSAAQALQQALDLPAERVELVHLGQLLAPLDVAQRWFGISMEEAYNRILDRGWTLGAGQTVYLLQAIIRHYQPQIEATLETFWRTRPPCLVVSVVPHFNPALGAALRRVCPGTPFVVVISDLADPRPSFWLTGRPDLVVCGTPRAVEQAHAAGRSDQEILATSGMMLHPRFYEPLEVDRETECVALGLDPRTPTGLVLFGGQGSKAMLEIHDSVDALGENVQLLYLCGHNSALQAALQARPSRHRKWVHGFTTRIPFYMRLADFFIGKPGPGSVSEAVHMGLPVVVAYNAWTLPQERYNAQWIRDNGLGLVVRHFRQVGTAVATLLQEGALERFRHNTRQHDNRAVFEVARAVRPLAEAGAARADRNGP